MRTLCFFFRSAAVAIEELRNYPIFLTVDHALKSERFCNGAEKNNSPKMNDSKDGGRTNSANRHHNNSKLNNTAQSTASEKNSPPKDVSSNGFFNSQDHSQLPPVSCLPIIVRSNLNNLLVCFRRNTSRLSHSGAGFAPECPTSSASVGHITVMLCASVRTGQSTKQCACRKYFLSFR